MKNIHLLPTEKPSRLGYLTKKGKEVYKDLRLFDILMPQILDSENQHIYITSKEEIKEGWYFNNAKAFNKPVYVKNEEIKGLKSLYGVNPNHLQKIILTDNQDLIKDSVQAIGDEFLEWFVKNPSCEKIGVTFGCMEIRSCMCGSIARCLKPGYKITIPKEEVLLQSSIDGEPIWGEAPKPMHEQIIEHCGGEEKFKEIAGLKPKQVSMAEAINQVISNELKQETLEEVAERYSIEQYPLSSFEGNQWNNQRHNCKLDFISGAEQQEEQTIEEVFEWLTSQDYLTDLKETLIENFKEFKNK